MNGNSLNITNDFIKKLKEIVPAAFTEDRLDITRLKQLLGAAINTDNERYELNWAGKNDAYKTLQTPTTATLIPDIDNSVDWENADNIFIEGENLEVLKVLQKSYYGKIKMIYIDPPYNTGNDAFIYPDKFAETKEAYWERINAKDPEGYLIKEELFRKNKRENGHFHSNWLSMMLPRLFLARNLLQEDGVIFISIDDNEVHNLKALCNEIFGEENFVADFIRKTKSTTNDAKVGLNYQHEFLFCYAKNKDLIRLLGEDKDFSKYQNPDNDPNGRWVITDPSAKSGNMTTGYFEIKNPFTGKSDYPPEGRFWLFSQNTIQKHINEGRICFKKKHKENERGFIYKRYLKDLKTNKKTFDSLKFTENMYMNQNATKELLGLKMAEYFSYPKGVNFIKEILKNCVSSSDLVFDFFAGSGTTAQAVMEFNKENLYNGGGGYQIYLCAAA